MWQLHSQGAGGIVGDEMGLGKTVQVCVSVRSHILIKTLVERGEGVSFIHLRPTGASIFQRGAPSPVSARLGEGKRFFFIG